jgi:hypothetical protein
MAAFNTFKVLTPEFKETYAPKKLRKPKPPKIPGYNGPKIVLPGGNSGQGGY